MRLSSLVLGLVLISSAAQAGDLNPVQSTPGPNMPLKCQAKAVNPQSVRQQYGADVQQILITGAYLRVKKSSIVLNLSKPSMVAGKPALLQRSYVFPVGRIALSGSGDDLTLTAQSSDGDNWLKLKSFKTGPFSVLGFAGDLAVEEDFGFQVRCEF